MTYNFDSIAFCGGGGKGAYHIGAWQALKEQGCLSSVKAVSGTSIGGFNAVLFALSDIETAKRAWRAVRTGDIYELNTGEDDGFFSRDGVVRMLDVIDFSKLENCKIKILINLYDKDKKKTESVMLNYKTREQAVNILLATSSIPLAFGTQKVDKNIYFDGGIKEERNAPIKPLYESNCRNIALLALNSKYEIGSQVDFIKGFNFEQLYPDAKIKIFKPLQSIGSFFSGTMDFSQRSINQRMFAGYSETRRMLLDEDIYIVKNDYTRLNLQIEKLGERIFLTPKDFETFVSTSNLNFNIDFPVVGGIVFWSNVLTKFDWKIQQNNINKTHYRILDPDDNRRAWVTDPDRLITAMIDYESSKKYD